MTEDPSTEGIEETAIEADEPEITPPELPWTAPQDELDDVLFPVD